MSDAVLSIGANIGDRLANLRIAVAELGERIRAVSPVFETAPWGVTDQPSFLNAILLVADPAATARDWLALAQRCEAAAARTRDLRWGPRTLDVDVITVDQLSSADPELTLPHPRAAERAFVLVPWLRADPDALLGDTRVDDVLATLPGSDRAGVRERQDLELR